MRTELVPLQTPILIDNKISEWIEQQPNVPLSDLKMLIGIRSEAGPIYRVIITSLEEYSKAYDYLARILRLIDELEDVSTQRGGLEAIFKTRAIRNSLSN